MAVAGVLGACRGGPTPAPPAANAPAPDAAAIIARERARVGGQKHLGAQGGAVLRGKDASGD
ncbi:MAG: hypothetical protein ACKOTD_08920, partial [Phycisphaerales bacterium]